ncbi:NAD(P)/FAD-dependent oxidoreductase, partial [Candidatus Woesearchaeota archaeon]|nr:NAD(P)/FAD-dependent oxidoreductase [Candidatus Woesearchaeota archaeon]
MANISIIGAGPAGNYAAYLLARQGHGVNVYEEHNAIGMPIQCTGLLTSQLDPLIKPKKEFMVNEATKARIYAPSGESIQVRFQNRNYVYHRALFDQHIASLAEEAGAKIHVQHKFHALEGKKFKVNDKVLETDYLIGADGPNSPVARAAGIYGKRAFSIGTQARVKTDCEKDVIEFWVGIGEFGWLVPENEETARVGICAQKHPSEAFKELINLRCPGAKILEWQSGPIPVYDHKLPIQKGHIRLIGDAATQVKATSYGGILFGMLAAKELEKDIGNYEKNYKKGPGKDLWLSLMIRRIMAKFSTKDYNRLIHYFQNEKLKNILEVHDRD